jgi:hypothetical protein
MQQQHTIEIPAPLRTAASVLEGEFAREKAAKAAFAKPAVDAAAARARIVEIEPQVAAVLGQITADNAVADIPGVGRMSEAARKSATEQHAALLAERDALLTAAATADAKAAALQGVAAGGYRDAERAAAARDLGAQLHQFRVTLDAGFRHDVGHLPLPALFAKYAVLPPGICAIPPRLNELTIAATEPPVGAWAAKPAILSRGQYRPDPDSEETQDWGHLPSAAAAIRRELAAIVKLDERGRKFAQGYDESRRRAAIAEAAARQRAAPKEPPAVLPPRQPVYPPWNPAPSYTTTWRDPPPAGSRPEQPGPREGFSGA